MAKKSKLIVNQVEKPADNRSVIKRIAEMNIPQAEKTKLLEDIIAKRYPDRGWTGLKYDWELHRRTDQWFDIIPDPNWRTACWLAGRGFGKGCVLSTQIPTPSGFITMGNIKVGDEVFDEQGRVCKVTAVTDEYIPEKAYRLYFSDGATLEVCDQHQFVTWTHADRKAYLRKDSRAINTENTNRFPDDWVNWKKKVHKGGNKISNDRLLTARHLIEKGESKSTVRKLTGIQGQALDQLFSGNFDQNAIEENTELSPKVRTTLDIISTFTYNNRMDLNHCIPVCKPIELDEKEFELSPYLYGVFLGDGCKHSGCISQGKEDYQDLKIQIEKEGYVVLEHNPITTLFRVKGLRRILTKMGLIKDKHVKKEYLRGSIHQRQGFLAGLMDTDGHFNKSTGHCEFVNTNKEIADAVFELLCSLGQKPVITEKDAKLNGVSKKIAYRVTFRPTIQVFRLPRKANQIKLEGRQMLRNHHRMIVKYEEINPSPMKCIQVDSANSMYLLGKNFIPSHNTRVAAEIARFLAESDTAKRIGVVCPTAHDANAVFLHGNSGLMNISPPWFRPEHHPTYKNVTWPGRDTVLYLFSAEDPESLRGHQFDWMIMDELAAWSKGKAVWEQAILVNRLGKHPRAIVTTTPKANELIKSVVGNPDTWTITGSTEENKDNIDVRQMMTLFEGTRLGRQELHGEILEDVEGALWKSEWIEKNRVHPREIENLPEFLYIVLAIDPAMTSNKNSDETGMCVAAYGADDRYYILYADSHRETPHEWARRAFALYDEYFVTSIVAETNNGGDLVLQNLTKIRPDISINGIHAKKGKALRAEEVVHLYELGKVRHIQIFPKAESQMAEFNPISNPNGHDDICLIGDTSITLIGGEQRPLKDVKMGDMVLTTEGHKKVLNSSITGVDSLVYSMLISDGTILTGTKNHPVYIAEKGFTQIKDIKVGDSVVKCQIKNPMWTQLNSMELRIDDTQILGMHLSEDTSTQAVNISNKDMEDYIEKFGDIFVEKFQKGTSYTTLTEITLITIFQIWNAFQKKNIFQNITKKIVEGEKKQNKLNTLIELDRWLQSGIALLKEKSGTKNMQKMVILEKLKIMNAFVLSAIQNSILSETALNSVLENAQASTIETQVNMLLKSNANFADLLSLIITHTAKEQESIVQNHVLGIIEARKDKVYNLHVEDKNEFFANGILTHNCDALVYSVKALMEKAMVSAVYSPSVGGIRQKLINFKAR
jgi:phage terminase large subunit-like protein